MNKLFLLAALMSGTATAQTTSFELDNLAKQVEAADVRSFALEKQGLLLLKEPVKTYLGVTLPTSPAQYMGSVDTALKLPLPSGYQPGFMCVRPTTCFASATNRPETGPVYALWAEAGSSSVAKNPAQNRASAMFAVILKAWAYELRGHDR